MKAGKVKLQNYNFRKLFHISAQPTLMDKRTRSMSFRSAEFSDGRISTKIAH